MSLEVLGLSNPEAGAYRALTEVPWSNAADLATRLELGNAEALDLLEALVKHHLAVRRPGEQYAAVRPAVALGALVADRADGLRAAEAAVADLESTFQEARRSQMPDAVLDIVHGPNEVAARLQQIQLNARREVLSLVKAPVAVISSTENGAEDVAMNRGVTYRVVLERAMLQEEPRLAQEIQRTQAAGGQARIAATVPTKMFIVDREIALVPLGIGTAPVKSAFLLGASGLLDALVALFEAVWDGAQDIDLGPPGVDVPGSLAAGLTPEDRTLLTLLLAGMTDDAVARELGISARTVQRRIRLLLDYAHVETRLQLGYAAARGGWAAGIQPPTG
ncbi:hypothetical protein [Nocardioides lianchengensis]|uniref:Uncharacterized protein n=1 Tax=Nocardioides lianchengensis TaxID=1045774 RepID=A0A1G7C2B6_9ACTN|nr:hypothetical protein [Nocardioides lianchengensis]NYG09267.1 DNA-binding NarL/FixJ family response regulator [Nocardioides lianchengensis]SDE33429.1 hypothetical protein SAMN05421872_12024 [Nocardioides lianchengensis]